MEKDVRVTIVGLSNNQQHENIGDGAIYFLGKNATVQSVSEEKVYLIIDGFDYILWFIKEDLKIIE